MPSMTCENCHMICGFSGLPKFRQLLAPTGVAPEPATLPAASTTARIVGKRGVWNIGNDLPVLQYAHARLTYHRTDFDGIQPPLAEYFVNFFLAAFLRDQQHALLRFAQQDLVRGHASLALRHAVHFN